jgi:hypothetical protein
MQPQVPDSIARLLEEKYYQYNTRAFIESDPVQIPHSFSEPENIEISGFLAATLAWGRRDTIIRNTLDLIRRMDMRPIDFIMNMKEIDRADRCEQRNPSERASRGADAVRYLATG